MERYAVLRMNNTSLRPLGLYDYKAYLSNELFARSLLVKIRWPEGVRCLKCQSSTIWRIGVDFQCGDCRAHFSPTSGSVFSKSHLTISQWIIAIALFKIGVNALGLQWAIGCHYRTARRVLHLIRAAVAKDPLLQKLSGEIEVDEAYYGGRQKGQRGRSARGKTIVLGFKERPRQEGDHPKAKTVVIPNVSESAILETIERHVDKGSTVYSDGFRGYNSLGANGYQHLPFDHSAKFIETDVIHTQGIESYWGVTKPLTKARYRKLTKENMPYICAENDFRFNHGRNHDFIRLVLMQLLKFHPLNA